MDGATLFRKGRAQNFLDPEHAATMLSWVQAFTSVEDRARVVTLDEIKAEDWTLNISRYVLPPIGADIPPLADAVADFKARVRDAEAPRRRWVQTCADAVPNVPGREAGSNECAC